jgi:hypothetical protein
VTEAYGVTLPVADTLGHAATSTLGPTIGSGFLQRMADDLSLLSEHGVTAVRLTFDWARLQPKANEFSAEWVETYNDIVSAADAAGIAVWATLFDAGVPRWFDDEGGISDDEALTRRWPHFVERVAERFGDRLAGWIPFAVFPSGLPARVWTDTWAILGGGAPPVATSFATGGGVGHIAQWLGQLDAVGIALDSLVTETTPSETEIRVAGDRWADAIHEAADLAGSIPIVVTDFTPGQSDPELDGRLVERMVEIVTDAIDDGIAITVAFAGPGIAGSSEDSGLFDIDRAPTPAGLAYFERP